MVQLQWRPRVEEGAGPLWRRIVDALAEDVKGGAITAGTRLPPHRELAFKLGIGVGTVSKAYVEAERRGLVTSHVGRGTFIADRPASSVQRSARRTIDMAMNTPPIGPALDFLDEALESLRHSQDVEAIADYSPTPGTEAVRRAGAEWLRTRGRVERASAERLIQTNGGQHALMLACSSFARPGDTILADRATYPGNRIIAEHAGWRLRAVAGDERGMDPESLARAAADSGARLVMLIPTLHNPTAITLDEQRRREIAAVARKHDLTIIEDDVYRPFGREGDPPPFAELAPERTVHVTSISKALAPGLRVGFIVPPESEAAHERLVLAARATGYCPPAAGGLIFAQWMANGTAERLVRAVRAEMEQRNALAREVLGGAISAPHSDCSLHIWLPMSAERAAQVAARAMQNNVEVTPPAAPFIDPAEVDGVRLCLGAAPDLDRLAEGLRIVKASLGDSNIWTRGIL
jgi:DNA-binding transcriptional MocR family regulator